MSPTVPQAIAIVNLIDKTRSFNTQIIDFYS